MSDKIQRAVDLYESLIDLSDRGGKPLTLNQLEASTLLAMLEECPTYRRKVKRAHDRFVESKVKS